MGGGRAPRFGGRVDRGRPGDIVRLYIKPYIGQEHFRTLNARDVARMLTQLDDAGLSGNTRRLARSVLRRALRWAEAEGMIGRNAAAVSHGVKLDNAGGRTLTPDQARTLLASLKRGLPRGCVHSRSGARTGPRRTARPRVG